MHISGYVVAMRIAANVVKLAILIGSGRQVDAVNTLRLMSRLVETTGIIHFLISLSLIGFVSFIICQR